MKEDGHTIIEKRIVEIDNWYVDDEALSKAYLKKTMKFEMTPAKVYSKT